MNEDDVGEGGVEEHVDHTVALGVRLGQGETHTWTIWELLEPNNIKLKIELLYPRGNCLAINV